MLARSLFNRFKFRAGNQVNGNGNGNTAISNDNERVTMNNSVSPAVMPVFTAASPSVNQRDRLSYGNSVTARGELRWHIFCAHTLNVILLLLFIFGFYVHNQVLNRFADKGYIVYQVENGHAVARSAADFRTTATDEEIQALALDIITYITEAGSDNVDENFAKAMYRMTPATRYDFDRVLGSQKEEIKRLRIYRKFENASVRALDENDLLSSNGQTSRYDVVVSGRVDTYRLGTTELLASGPVSYHIQLVPLPKRTVQNPSALLVSSLEKLNERALEQRSNMPDALEKPATTSTLSEKTREGK